MAPGPTDLEAWETLQANAPDLDKVHKSKELKGAMHDIMSRSWDMSESRLDFADFSGVWFDAHVRQICNKFAKIGPGRETFNMATYRTLKTSRLEGYWDVLLENLADWIEAFAKEFCTSVTLDNYKRLVDCMPPGRNLETYRLNLGNLFWRAYDQRATGFLSQFTAAAYEDAFNTALINPPDEDWDLKLIMNQIHDKGILCKSAMLHVGFWFNPDLEEPAYRAVAKPPMFDHLKIAFSKYDPSHPMYETDESWKSQALELQRVVLKFTLQELPKSYAIIGNLRMLQEMSGQKYGEYVSTDFWKKLRHEIRRYTNVPFRHVSLVRLEDLTKVEAAITEAKKEVSNIKQQHLTEIISMSKPPHDVKVALSSVCMLLGYRIDGWKTVQDIVRRDDFITSIINHNNETQIKNLAIKLPNEFLSKEDFPYEEVSRDNKACDPLMQWARALVKYSEALDRVLPLREEVGMFEGSAQVIESTITDLEAKVRTSTQTTNQMERDVLHLHGNRRPQFPDSPGNESPPEGQNQAGQITTCLAQQRKIPKSTLSPGGQDGSRIATYCNTSEMSVDSMRPSIVAHPISGAKHQDYQLQLMLLEQQNKRRLDKARQEQDSMGGISRDGPDGGRFQGFSQGGYTRTPPNLQSRMESGDSCLNSTWIPPLPKGHIHGSLSNSNSQQGLGTPTENQALHDLFDGLPSPSRPNSAHAPPTTGPPHQALYHGPYSNSRNFSKPTHNPSTYGQRIGSQPQPQPAIPRYSDLSANVGSPLQTPPARSNPSDVLVLDPATQSKLNAMIAAEVAYLRERCRDIPDTGSAADREEALNKEKSNHATRMSQIRKKYGIQTRPYELQPPNCVRILSLDDAPILAPKQPTPAKPQMTQQHKDTPTILQTSQGLLPREVQMAQQLSMVGTMPDGMPPPSTHPAPGGQTTQQRTENIAQHPTNNGTQPLPQFNILQATLENQSVVSPCGDLQAVMNDSQRTRNQLERRTFEDTFQRLKGCLSEIEKLELQLSKERKKFEQLDGARNVHLKALKCVREELKTERENYQQLDMTLGETRITVECLRAELERERHDSELLKKNLEESLTRQNNLKEDLLNVRAQLINAFQELIKSKENEAALHPRGSAKEQLPIAERKESGQNPKNATTDTTAMDNQAFVYDLQTRLKEEKEISEQRQKNLESVEIERDTLAEKARELGTRLAAERDKSEQLKVSLDEVRTQSERLEKQLSKALEIERQKSQELNKTFHETLRIFNNESDNVRASVGALHKETEYLQRQKSAKTPEELSMSRINEAPLKTQLKEQKAAIAILREEKCKNSQESTPEEPPIVEEISFESGVRKEGCLSHDEASPLSMPRNRTKNGILRDGTIPPKNRLVGRRKNMKRVREEAPTPEVDPDEIDRDGLLNLKTHRGSNKNGGKDVKVSYTPKIRRAGKEVTKRVDEKSGRGAKRQCRIGVKLAAITVD